MTSPQIRSLLKLVAVYSIVLTVVACGKFQTQGAQVSMSTAAGIAGATALNPTVTSVTKLEDSEQGGETSISIAVNDRGGTAVIIVPGTFGQPQTSSQLVLNRYNFAASAQCMDSAACNVVVILLSETDTSYSNVSNQSAYLVQNQVGSVSYTQLQYQASTQYQDITGAIAAFSSLIATLSANI